MLKSLKRLQVGVGKSMYSLNNSKELLGIFRREGWRILTLALGRLPSATRLQTLHNAFIFFMKINKHHGPTYTIKYMKACVVAIHRKIGKTPFNSLRDLEENLPLPRLSCGLPVFIPKDARRRIRRGDKSEIRFWQTIYSLYRVLEAPMKPKLNTITDEYKGSPDGITKFNNFVSNHLFGILPKNVLKLKFKTSANSIVRSRSSGPNNSVAMSSVMTDLCRILQSQEDYDLFRKYAIASESYELMHKLDTYTEVLYQFLMKGGKLHVKSELSDTKRGKLLTPVENGHKLRLGQLSFKEEAAGKLRVFALVDIWTQSFLKPVHQSLFSILRGLPNDGTFDQDASVRRSIEKSNLKGYAYSVDLSAATDRLPLAIQAHLLSEISKKSELGKAWSELLVNRDYIIPKNSYGLPEGPIRYKVGQPMGALSSWAMLAFTHHMIVQYCYFRAYGTSTKWFTGYEVLGDDIVIFDHNVYREYLLVLAELGAPANESKSIPSPFASSFEFAKRSVLDSVDVSGISWKELLQGNSLPGKINLILRLGDRGLINNFSVLKSCLVRFSNNVGKPLDSKGIPHALLSILGSLTDVKDSFRLAVATLMNPHEEEQDIQPNKVEMPMYQAMRLVLAILNKKENYESCISDLETRLEIADEEWIPFIAQTAYHKALDLAKTIDSEYDKWIGEFSKTLLPIDRKSDSLLKAQLRSISEDILLGNFDPTIYKEEVYDACYQAAKYGMPFHEAISLYDKTLIKKMQFDFSEVKQAKIATRSWLPLMASQAGWSGKVYWRSETEFSEFSPVE